MDPKVLVAEGEELTELYEDSNGHLPQSLRDMGINNIKDLGRFNLPGGQSVSSHAPCDFDDGAFFFLLLRLPLGIFVFVPDCSLRRRKSPRHDTQGLQLPQDDHRGQVQK
jgi:hypothetical protein